MKSEKSPAELSVQLLESDEHDNELVLTATEDFYDDVARSEFDSRFEAMASEFSEAQEKLAEIYGQPVFTGDSNHSEFPEWASSGHRLAFWNVGGRILYLHITQTDKDLPLELTLGVVDGPPKEWYIGFNPFDAG